MINPTEAETVRLIFRRYLELGSVSRLQSWLAGQNIGSKQRLTAKGRVSGGGPMGRGPLFHLLRNRIYIGQISHRKACYPGAHSPILEVELFEKVQCHLIQATRRGTQ